MSRGAVTTKRLMRVGQSNDWVCWLCGEPTIAPFEDGYEPDHPDAATVDHVVPRVKGGTNAPGNLMTAHRRCNNDRGSRDLSRDQAERFAVAQRQRVASKRQFAQAQKGPNVRRGNQAKPLPNHRRNDRPLSAGGK